MNLLERPTSSHFLNFTFCSTPSDRQNISIDAVLITASYLSNPRRYIRQLIFRSLALINRLPNPVHRSIEASRVTTPRPVAPARHRRTSSRIKSKWISDPVFIVNTNNSSKPNILLVCHTLKKNWNWSSQNDCLTSSP